MEHSELRRKEQREAQSRGSRFGYSPAADARKDKEIADTEVRKGFKEHDDQLHGGKTTRLKLRAGGKVDGHKPQERLDKRARGGATMKKPHTTNIMIDMGGKGNETQAAQEGMRTGAMLGARGAANQINRPPPMMGPPGGMPQRGMPPGGGASPVMPPGGAQPMMAAGGVVDAGAGSGEGRLEKSGEESMVKVKSHVRRKAGGRVDGDCE